MHPTAPIPLEYYAVPGSAGYFICKAQYQKNTLNLVIDTGASVTVLDRNRILQIQPHLITQASEKNILGLGWHTGSALQALIPEIRLAHKVLHQMDVVLLDFNPINQKMAVWEMPRLDGLLGNDVLLQMGAIINLPNRRIEFA